MVHWSNSTCNPDNFKTSDSVHLMVDMNEDSGFTLTVASPDNACTQTIQSSDKLGASPCKRDASWHLGRTDNNATGLITAEYGYDFVFDNAVAQYEYNGAGVNASNSSTTANDTPVIMVGLDGKARDSNNASTSVTVVDEVFYNHTINKYDIKVTCGRKDATTVLCTQVQKVNGTA